MGTRILHRADFMSDTQKAKMAEIKHRTHAACLKATGVARPGKTAKDRFMSGQSRVAQRKKSPLSQRTWEAFFYREKNMDRAKKKSGNPSSLSRKWEKANKKNTNKKRRQEKY